MPSDPEQLVRTFVEAFNRSDVVATREVVSEDFELIEASALPGAARTRGRDENDRYFRGFQRNWSEWRWTPVLVESNGDRVLMQADLWLRASHTGIAVERRWWYVFTIREHRIIRQHGFDSDDETGARAAFSGG